MKTLSSLCSKKWQCHFFEVLSVRKISLSLSSQFSPTAKTALWASNIFRLLKPSLRILFRKPKVSRTLPCHTSGFVFTLRREQAPPYIDICYNNISRFIQSSIGRADCVLHRFRGYLQLTKEQRQHPKTPSKPHPPDTSSSQEAQLHDSQV